MKYLKDHLLILFSYIGALLVSSALGNSILWLICIGIGNWIGYGADYVERFVQVVMRALWPMIATSFIYLRKIKDRGAYGAFRVKVRENGYSLKADFIESFRNKDLWYEIIFVTVITTLFWLRCFPMFWILLNIPYFFLFEFLSNLIFTAFGCMARCKIMRCVKPIKSRRACSLRLFAFSKVS